MNQDAIKKENQIHVDQSIVKFFDLLARFDYKDKQKEKLESEIVEESQRKENPLLMGREVKEALLKPVRHCLHINVQENK
jgi:hypothetical protein